MFLIIMNKKSVVVFSYINYVIKLIFESSINYIHLNGTHDKQKSSAYIIFLKKFKSKFLKVLFLYNLICIHQLYELNYFINII